MESPEDPSLYRFSLFFRYDTAADRLDALPLPERTQAVTYDAETGVLWVGNVAGSRLFRIRADAFDHQLEFTCEMVARNSDPSCVCPDDAGDLYAEYPAHRDVQDVIIERDKNRMLVFYETPSDELAWRSLPHEATIWQLEPMKMIKQVFNPSADFVRRSAKTGHYYTQVDWIPPGVAELDQDTLQIRRTLMWPFGFGLDVDPATGDLFLVNPVTGRLYRIDPVGLKVVDSMKIGIGLKSVTVDSGRGLLYVGNYFTGDFYVVSWNDKKVLATANVGQRNYATLVVPESGRVFTTTTYGFFEIKVDELIARGTADE
ncbi:MAG: hypothetical protein M5R36_14950 [Deltaproteobacteria bacterium]|nr:hypothetical protein [Deltaproteobacteria bacterium]